MMKVRFVASSLIIALLTANTVLAQDTLQQESVSTDSIAQQRHFKI